MTEDEDYEPKITAADIENELVSHFGNVDTVERVETFSDSGFKHEGVVIRMGDGSEFHVTIVQSRKAI